MPAGHAIRGDFAVWGIRVELDCAQTVKTGLAAETAALYSFTSGFAADVHSFNSQQGGGFT